MVTTHCCWHADWLTTALKTCSHRFVVWVIHIPQLSGFVCVWNTFPSHNCWTYQNLAHTMWTNLADFIKCTPADKASTFVQECMTVQHAVGIRSNYEEQSLYYMTGWVSHKYLQHAKVLVATSKWALSTIQSTVSGYCHWLVNICMADAILGSKTPSRRQGHLLMEATWKYQVNAQQTQTNEGNTKLFCEWRYQSCGVQLRYNKQKMHDKWMPSTQELWSSIFNFIWIKWRCLQLVSMANSNRELF